MNSSKAQVSLEYLLIALAIISVLSILIYQITNLYNKNIQAIDNLELKNTSKNIQDTLDLFNLQPKGIMEISINPQQNWYLETTKSNLLKIKNKNKEYSINSNNNLFLKTKQITKPGQIVIEKKDNRIIISYYLE